MNKYFQTVKTRLSSSSAQELIIGVAVVLAVIGVIIAIILFIQSSGIKIVYQPAVACNLLTRDEAKEMLGDNVLGGEQKNPTISGDTVTSKCSYSDVDSDKDQMLVAAVAIRSGINDKGVEQNKTEFAVGKSSKGVKVVDNVGDSAYFNPERGQLNVLSDGKWFILSYGIGNAPETNTVDKAIELSQRVLFTPELPTF